MPEAHPAPVVPGALAPPTLAPAILMAMDDGVVVSRDGRLVFANPAAERILGVAVGELADGAAEPRWHLVDLDGRPLPVEDGPTRRTLRSGEPRVRELVGVRRPDGDVRWVEVTTAILPDAAGVLTTLTDATERRQAERELTWVADHDALTGLVNRRRFTADLAAELARIRRTGREGSVVMLDLDRFEDINDSLGHRIGDQLLRHVAALLAERLRETDVLARLGGDEFAIVLPETPLPAAGGVVRALVALIADRPMAVDGGDTVRVTASSCRRPTSSTSRAGTGC